MGHLHIRHVRLVELEVVAREDCGNRNVELCLSETVTIVSKIPLEIGNWDLLDTQALPCALTEGDEISLQLRMTNPPLGNEFPRIWEDLLVHENVVRRHAHGRIAGNRPIAILQFRIRSQAWIPRYDAVSQPHGLVYNAV